MLHKSPCSRKQTTDLQDAPMISSKNAFDLGIKWQFPDARRYTFVFLSLFFVLLLIYSNSFDSSFHFDDTPNILSNPNVQPDSLSWEELKKSFYGRHLDQEEIKRPFSYMTLAINYYFSGNNVFSYHVVNFVIHFISAAFLFLLLYNTLKLPLLKRRYEKSAYAIALLAVFFWATHPIQLTAVTYIVQRMAGMAGMFYVMAMYFYLKARTNPRWGRQIVFYGLCGLAALFAFASKENAAMLPVVLFVFDLLLIQGLSRENLKRAGWLAAAAGLVFVVLAFFYVDAGSLFSGYDNRPFTLAERLMTQPRIVMLYISLLFYPVSSRLMFIHDMPLSHSLIDPWTTAASLLAILLLLAAALYYARKWPLIAFCVIFFFINHFIESSIIPLELVYEHRNYIPSMLFFVLAAVVMVRVLDYFSYKSGLQFLMAFGFCFLLAAQAHTTYDRNKIWKNEILLWTSNTSKAPKTSRVHTNLGNAYADLGINSKAVKQFKKALELKNIKRKENLAKLLHNAGVASRHEGDGELALRYFKKALEINPGRESTLALLCEVYIERGRLKEANSQLQARIRDETKLRSAKLLYVYALVMYHRGNIEKALALARRSLRKNPDYWSALPVIAQSLKAMGKSGKAEWYWRQYLQKRPHSLKARLALIELNVLRKDTRKSLELIEDLLCLAKDKNICHMIKSNKAKDVQLAVYTPDMDVIQQAVENFFSRKKDKYIDCAIKGK